MYQPICSSDFFIVTYILVPLLGESPTFFLNYFIHSSPCQYEGIHFFHVTFTTFTTWQDGTDDAAQMKTCLKFSSIPIPVGHFDSNRINSDRHVVLKNLNLTEVSRIRGNFYLRNEMFFSHIHHGSVEKKCSWPACKGNNCFGWTTFFQDYWRKRIGPGPCHRSRVIQLCSILTPIWRTWMPGISHF